MQNPPSVQTSKPAVELQPHFWDLHTELGNLHSESSVQGCPTENHNKSVKLIRKKPEKRNIFSKQINFECNV